MRTDSLDKRVRPEVGMGTRYHEAMTDAMEASAFPALTRFAELARFPL